MFRVKPKEHLRVRKIDDVTHGADIDVEINTQVIPKRKVEVSWGYTTRNARVTMRSHILLKHDG